MLMLIIMLIIFNIIYYVKTNMADWNQGKSIQQGCTQIQSQHLSIK